jgi:hypothetical protein
MLKTAQGVYHDGIVELDDKPDDLVSGRVIVMFLENVKAETNAAERIANLRAWLPTLPDVPYIPLEALDRGQLSRP